MVHPGRGITKLQFGALFAVAWGREATITTAINGFQACGLYPINKNAIPDAALAPSKVSNREMPKQNSSDVRNRSRMDWIQLNYQVTQLRSGHGHFRAYLRRFVIQEYDTCDCDLQESETILHLVNDCPHHTEERRTLSVAAVRAGVEWPPALVFWVQRATFPLFLTLAKSVQVFIMMVT